jgi:hypothetical protein
MVILLIIVLVLIVMVGAGSVCVHSHGTHRVCGSAGEAGGVLMILIGTIWICIFLLAVRLIVVGVTDNEMSITVLLPSAVMAGFIMVTAGSICMYSHGESEVCGPGGEGGGIAMVVLGSVLLSSLVCTAHRIAESEGWRNVMVRWRRGWQCSGRSCSFR